MSALPLQYTVTVDGLVHVALPCPFDASRAAPRCYVDGRPLKSIAIVNVETTGSVTCLACLNRTWEERAP